ncbi:MAG: serine/threonine-protein kinase [Acidobacteriota bacterium]
MSDRDPTTDPRWWMEVDALFDRVLDLDPAARQGVLEVACRHRPELRLAVESLVAADREAQSFLSQPLGRVTTEPRAEPPAGRVLQQAGPYRLLELLARGGMGEVYLASRADQAFDRLVAIKVLPQQFAGSDLQRRFALERRILGSLEHRAIARLYDAGELTDGRPYLVMELVQGESIGDFSRHRKLSLEARIALVLEVCEALAHAHRHGIIHRDLKPANLLVTADREPKVVDFGIATILGASGNQESAADQALTPTYASPEQLRGEAVTTASDVYSLGVVLFELLCGARPRDLETTTKPGEATPAASLHAAYAGFDAAVQQRLAREAGTTAKKLGRALSGDLDSILRRATDADVDERYDSIEAFARDLKRFLQRRPVSARRLNPPQRIRKWAQRNPLAAFALGLSTALALVLAASLLRHHLRINQARQTAEKERDRAQQVLQFVVDSFAEGDLRHRPSGARSVRDLLETAAARIDRELADHPEAAADVSHTVGSALAHLDASETAAPLLQRALRQRQHGNPAKAAETLSALAAVERRAGRYGQARQYLEEALELLDQAPPSVIAQAQRDLAMALLYEGRHDQAEGLAEAALTNLATGTGEKTDWAEGWYVLAAILVDGGAPGRAETYVDQAYDHLQSAGGLDSLLGSDLLHLKSILVRELEGAAEALPWYQRSLELRRRLFGTDSSHYAAALHSAGLTHWRAGELATADELLRESVRILAASQPPNPAAEISARRDFGLLLAARQVWSAADEELQTALSLQRAEERDPAQEVPLLINLSHLSIARGEHATALAWARQGVALIPEDPAAEHWVWLQCQVSLAKLLATLGSDEAAAALASRASSQSLDWFGPEHENTRRVAERLAHLL